MGLLIGLGGTKPTFAYDYYYGIEWDTSVSNPVPTRIGKAELHASLPVQSMIRRCTLADDGTVNYYLHANDSTKQDNGAAAHLDGTDGQVMVELPDCYARFEMDGLKRRALISTEPLPGFIKWNKAYISAYEAACDRTTASTPKLASVVNTSEAFRGGNNTAEWDGTHRSLLGRPATSISLTNFRTYARRRGTTEWNCNVYQLHKELWWFFAIEYCNFNSQAAFNAALDSNGYRQGGLGSGVTTLSDSKWSAWNSYEPFVPCGTTNSLGNHTGVVDYVLEAGGYDTAATTVHVPSYRGVENPFGHIWKWTDGCKAIIQSEAAGGRSMFYTCDNPANFTSSGVANYNHRGDLPRTNGYVKEILLGEYGEIMPLSIGGGSTTYFCDNFYTSVPESGSSERGVLFGGGAYYDALAGFVSANTFRTASYTAASLGSRLCFIPAA
jgi:hypothetical protein